MPCTTCPKVQLFAFLEATQPATLAAIPQPNTLNETAVQKYIFTRTNFYRDFTNQPEVKIFLVNELFRYDYDG